MSNSSATNTLLVLTTDEIQDYHIDFVGQRQEGDLHFYVFDVAPIAPLQGKPYFDGRIWVDGSDFRIVKSQGS